MTATPTPVTALCVSQKGSYATIDFPIGAVDTGDTAAVVEMIQPQLEQVFGEQLRAGERAGLVFIYGGAARVGSARGLQWAKKLEDSFRRIPAFAEAAYSPEGLHQLDLDPGKAYVMAYFLVQCDRATASGT